MSPTASRITPYLVTHFFVEIDGISQAGFRECSSLEIQTEVYEYQEGGLNEFKHKLPGRSACTNITLRYGTSSSLDLWHWYQNVVRGRIERKNISIVLYNTQQEEVMRWNLRSAYPVKWVSPRFFVDKAEVACDTLEIAFQGIEVL
jgi:phage tail-like protein